MKRYATSIFVIGLAFLHFSCASSKKEHVWKAVVPEGVVEKVAWTEEELSKDPTTRNITATKDSSFHFLHLQGSERPHTHDDHDLYAFIISGESKLNMAGKEFILKQGDGVFIPRGTVHWAENVDPKGSEAYVVFVPALTEPDHHELGKRTL